MVSVRCMGPLLPGGISLTVKRVPFGGGGVPSRRAPMSSAFSPIEMSAGVRSVHQMSVDCPPDLERLRFAAGASIKTAAVLFDRCPVTTLRIGAKFSFAISSPYLHINSLARDPAKSQIIGRSEYRITW